MTTFYEYPDYLCHYGVKGQKWGVRRYQNADGTLTDAGKKRLYKDDRKELEKSYKKAYSDTARYVSRARDYYYFQDKLPDDDANEAWKDTYDAHEKAVKSSREMRAAEKAFMEKYGDYKVRGLLNDKDAIARGKKTIIAMPEQRLTYEEGAFGGFFNFVYGPEGNFPTWHNKLIK